MTEQPISNGAAGTDGAETVVGQDPRQECLDLLDGAWNTRLAEAEMSPHARVAEGGPGGLAETQLAAAQITALIYIGDQVRELTEAIVGRANGVDMGLVRRRRS